MNKRSMCLVAAAAAMVALAPSIARADDTATTTTTSTTTTTTQFVPINIPTIAPVPTGPNGEPIDYTALAGKSYDYMDLNQARTEGFSDHDIAVMAKIADRAGVPFDLIKQESLDGMAYPTIADKYGLRLGDVLNATDYQDKVANYRLAYETTGSNSIRNLVAAYQEQYPATTMTTVSTTSVSSNDSLADVVNSTPELSMFARAVRRARLMKVLNGDGPYTVFAPTDSAFARLSSDQINALMNNRDMLVKVIDFSIIPQRIDAAQASSWTSSTLPTSLEGDPLGITTMSSGNWMVGGANIVKPDMFARNGVIHEVDTVLLPPSVTTITTTNTTVTAPTTTIAPNSQTVVSPNGTTTTVTPNGVTTVQPNGTTTVEPAPAP